MTQGEVEATSSNSVQVTENLEIEGERGDNPLLARRPVSEYPDWNEGGNGPVGSGELASSCAKEKPGGATFYCGGLIYRRWSPKNRDVLSWDQLVLPQQCRQLVLNLAHDIPTAGHLGTNKTRGRILKCYYWPGVFKQVAGYSKTCKVCQKSQHRSHMRQAEMISMLLIDQPFQRIAMDVVGPLSRSRSGNIS